MDLITNLSAAILTTSSESGLTLLCGMVVIAAILYLLDFLVSS